MQNQKCTDQIIGLKESQIGIDAKRSTNWSSRFIVRSGVPSRKSVSWFCILHQQTTYPYALAPDPSQEFDDTKRISDAAIRRLSAPKEYAREEGL